MSDKKIIDKADKIAEKTAMKKIEREEVVRKYARANFHFGTKFASIKVMNVYGDNYRVNFYVDDPSDNCVVVSRKLFASEFVKFKVDNKQTEESF